ncbi:VAMP synaptobrevin-like protein [Lentinula edodes]|uniref:VAMP synaptobrevin-like protein n=1 Tax=Lentinula edodes TaxID=5353 RepID=A0A1Q3EPE1_LENED|nr:VAMP synaptobrevin-like protein [Lentinula edodes]
MSLIHALVAQGPTILAEHKAGSRDFSQATQTILSKIPPNNSKLTYVWEQYLFHYVSEGGFTYLVMADDSAGGCRSHFSQNYRGSFSKHPLLLLSMTQNYQLDKTDVMAGQATAFRRGARSVRRQMWWRNKKILGLSILVALVLVWILLAQFCGAGLRCDRLSLFLPGFIL